MKIAIEAGVLANDRKSGVYYYVQRLLRAVLATDTTNSYTLVYFGHPPDAARNFDLKGANLQLHPVTWLPRKVYSAFLRTPLRLPIDMVAGLSADVFVFPRFVRWPLRRTPKSVVLVYDTSYLDSPDAMETRHYGWYLRQAVPRSVRAASHIITISAATKQSLIRHYQLPPEKISVVTPALDHTVFKPPSKPAVAAIKQKYGITRDYLLYVGTIEPRKNVATILEAYRSLPTDLRAQYQLVIAGGKGWQDAAVTKAAAELDTGELVQTGFVEEADLPALYGGASLFVYPSRYEGWGMPVLEAMACGTPVITADNSSLPEAGGEAARYVTAGDTGQLSTAMIQLLQAPTERAAMAKRGLAHARRFTWQDSAQRFHQIIEGVYRS